VRVTSFESVSTWRQDTPTPASAERTALLRSIAEAVVAVGPNRLRIAIDGRTAAGKTSFGHELAAAVRTVGRPTMRASLDDFKKPWRDAIEKGYDRITGDGYYRNAPDFESARRLLLEPSGPNGSGVVTLCAHDPLTGKDHRDLTVRASTDSVLIVDSVFAFRPEYDVFWDYRIWLDIAPNLALQRGIERDTPREGGVRARQLHEDRYHQAELIYLKEVNPLGRADIVIDNTEFALPRVISTR
jgi:uridine kinase